MTGSQRMSSADHCNSESPPRGRPIPYDLKRALDYMRESVGRKISVTDLVAHSGVAERTLHKHFRAFMAVSPLEYWRRLRLAAAREDLLKGATGTSVTAVATRFGFSHFGRFSQHYRACFGETPSTTLRRSRMAERGRAGRRREDEADDAGAVAVAARWSRERPTVAILPCQVSAAEPGHRFFAECVAEGIAAALCRVRSLSVAVPRSSRSVGARDPQRLARELGARYLLIGSIAQSGERLRITIRLLDATTESHVWGDIYDGDTADQLALQDRVTEGVIRAIAPCIRGAEIDRARRKPPNDLDAYGFTMRAFPFVFAAFPQAAKRALELLDRAMEIDPDYAPATALAAWCHAQLVIHNGSLSPRRERARSLLLSERAGILDPDDPLVLTARGAVHTVAGHLDHAGNLVARALALDPTFVWGWDRSGWVKAFQGEPEAAIKQFNQATRLDSRPPDANRLIGIGSAHFDAGRYDQAVLWKRKALQQQPGTAWINRTLSVSYARLGERRAALESIDALHRYSADLTIGKIVAAIPFTQDFLDRVAEGLDDLGLSA
jgi:TolB-like protein/Flp pilus assembly protein TadD